MADHVRDSLVDGQTVPVIRYLSIEKHGTEFNVNINSVSLDLKNSNKKQKKLKKSATENRNAINGRMACHAMTLLHRCVNRAVGYGSFLLR